MDHRDRTLGALEYVCDIAVIVHDRVVGADDPAGAAIDARRSLDVINLFRKSRDCAGRTALFTRAASGAVLCDDRECNPCSLLPHLVDNSFAMPMLDQLIVAPRLLQRDVCKKHHQDHHRDNRNIIRYGQDFEKLLKPADMFH